MALTIVKGIIEIPFFFASNAMPGAIRSPVGLEIMQRPYIRAEIRDLPLQINNNEEHRRSRKIDSVNGAL
jgi:hypothetical protein